MKDIKDMENLRIVRFTAENFKRLVVADITPDGDLVQITGDNGNGKSSVLDAIYMALAGLKKDITQTPIRKGEDKAIIKLDLGELIVTRKFAAAEEGGYTSSLTVKSAGGATFSSGQKVLDELLGALTFDPLAFTKLKPAEQVNQLRNLVELDIDIDELDRLNKEDYAKRTEINREVKSLGAQIDAIDVPPDTPAKPVDISALTQQMAEAAKHNADIETRKQRREAVARGIQEAEQQAVEYRIKINKLRAEIEELDSAAMRAEQLAKDEAARLASAPPLPEPIDVASVQEQINQASIVNERVALLQRKQALRATLDAEQAQSDALTEAMVKRTMAKEDAIKAAKMPVPGLGFGEDVVLFNDLPLADASSAEQLRVSMAIAMALNPKLRILRIKDGSLLGPKSLQLVAELAHANNFQVWLEQVETSGEVGFVMVDGRVHHAEHQETINPEEKA